MALRMFELEMGLARFLLWSWAWVGMSVGCGFKTCVFRVHGWVRWGRWVSLVSFPDLSFCQLLYGGSFRGPLSGKIDNVVHFEVLHDF